jgi:hypothetical protein
MDKSFRDPQRELEKSEAEKRRDERNWGENIRTMRLIGDRIVDIEDFKGDEEIEEEDE